MERTLLASIGVMAIITLLAFSSALGILFNSVSPASAQEVRSSGLQTRVLVRSAARVDMRSDLAATIAKAPFRDGMRFDKGDTLIAFDCRRYKAELNAAQASAEAAAVELRNKRRLKRHGAAGGSEVELAQAEAARANADVKARKTRTSQCVIQAPFKGRVVALHTREFEMPDASKPLITVLNDSTLELELVVPSNWLIWLKPNLEFQFTVDETGQTHTGRIIRLGAEVDPVSQTIRAFGLVLGDDSGVLAGMSGQARFEPQGS